MVIVFFEVEYTSSFPFSVRTLTSYPVILLPFNQFNVNSLLPAFACKLLGIFNSGAGILFSISFTNSTLEISTRLPFLIAVAVTLIVTFLTAICPPKSMLIEPSS